MLTARGGGLLVAAAALWIVGRSFGASELHLVAVAVLVLIALAVVTVLVSSRNLTVSRVAEPSRLPFGGQATVRVALSNQGSRPTSWLLLRDQVPSTLGSAPRLAQAPLTPRQALHFTYTLHGTHRGRSRLGPLRIEVRDPFGLFGHRLDIPGITEVVVRPRVLTLPPGLPLGGSSASGSDGRPRPQATGEDLADVRDYIRGDDLRSVHWATTAHRGKLMVRHSESPQDPGATVLLDVRASRHRGAGAAGSLETAITAAASVVTHLQARGRAVTLLDRITATPPRPRSADAWLDRLAVIDPDPADVLGGLRQPGGAGLGTGVVVAIVTVPDATELRQLVTAGRGAGTRVALLVDAASHGEHRNVPRAALAALPAPERAAAALVAAGWRVSVVRSIDEIPRAWRDVVTARRLAVAAR